MKVTVDMNVCQHYAQCVFEAPAVFDLDENNQLVYEPDPANDLRQAVEAAAAACPVQAILVTGR
jgi:ferredoxin